MPTEVNLVIYSQLLLKEGGIELDPAAFLNLKCRVVSPTKRASKASLNLTPMPYYCHYSC